MTLRLVASQPRTAPWVVFARPQGYRCTRCLSSFQVVGYTRVGAVIDTHQEFSNQHAKCKARR